MAAVVDPLRRLLSLNETSRFDRRDPLARAEVVQVDVATAR